MEGKERAGEGREERMVGSGRRTNHTSICDHTPYKYSQCVEVPYGLMRRHYLINTPLEVPVTE